MLLIAVIMAVVFFGIALLATRNDAHSGKGKDEIMKSVYYYGVLFTTLLMIIGGSVFAFMAIADIVSPPPYYQSYENYREMKLHETNPKEGPSQGTQKEWTEEEIRQKYQEEVRYHQTQQKQRAYNDLIKSLGWIVVPLPIFLYFQRKVRSGKVE